MPPSVPAAVVAVGLLAASGGAYRWAAHRLARSPSATPLTSEKLAALPLRVGAWEGVDVPMDEAIIEATDADAHVHRLYRRGGHAVGLYVAYGIRTRDLAPHRPEVCYPGFGWTLRRATEVALPVADGTDLPCTVYRFDRGALETDCVVVLNYYIVDGRSCPNVGAIRRIAWRGQAAVSYLAQVQVTCQADDLIDPDTAERRTREFLCLAAPRIAALFERNVSTEDDW